MGPSYPLVDVLTENDFAQPLLLPREPAKVSRPLGPRSTEFPLSDPFRRLERHVIGGHLHGLPGMILRLHARSERPVFEPPVLSGQPKQLIETGTRQIRRLARPEPNAPQLIRVVKTPYSLSPGWARRKKVREARARLEPFRREAAIVLALEAAQRPPFLSPALQRPRASYPDFPRDLAARYASECPEFGGPE